MKRLLLVLLLRLKLRIKRLFGYTGLVTPDFEAMERLRIWEKETGYWELLFSHNPEDRRKARGMWREYKRLSNATSKPYKGKVKWIKPDPKLKGDYRTLFRK